jgi:hypothetical protein
VLGCLYISVVHWKIEFAIGASVSNCVRLRHNEGLFVDVPVEVSHEHSVPFELVSSDARLSLAALAGSVLPVHLSPRREPSSIVVSSFRFAQLLKRNLVQSQC